MEISAIAGTAVMLQQAKTGQELSVALMKNAADAQNQTASLVEQSANQGKAAAAQRSISIYA